MRVCQRLFEKLSESLLFTWKKTLLIEAVFEGFVLDFKMSKYSRWTFLLRFMLPIRLQIVIQYFK